MDGKVTRFLKASLVSDILASVCLCVFGLCLFMWAEHVTNLLSIVFGVVLIIYGVSKVITYYNEKDGVDLGKAIIAIAIGCVLIFRASLLKELVSIIFGVLILIISITNLISALTLQKNTNIKQTKPIIIASIGGIIGLLCLTSKFILPDFFLQVVGAFIFVFGIMNIINSFLLKK